MSSRRRSFGPIGFATAAFLCCIFAMQTSIHAESPPKKAKPLQPVAKGLPNQKLGAPRALIVAFDAYEKLDKLEYCVASSIALAKSLAKQGYLVTFASSKASMNYKDDPKSELKRSIENQLKGDSYSIVQIDDSESLEAAWRDWMDDNFLDAKAASQSPFGFVIFSGHGELRSAKLGERETFFKTTSDGAGNEGILIEAMQKYCRDNNLPIVMLMDVCRSSLLPGEDEADGKAELVSGPKPSDTTLMVMQNRGNRFGFRETRGTPLTIWSSEIGGAAGDKKKDMLAVLAKGLEVDTKKPGLFLARAEAAAGVAGLERETDLSILSWFRYAILHETIASRNTRQYRIELGNVDQQMIIASTEKGRLAYLFALARQTANLIDSWAAVAGDFTADKTPNGVKIEHPKGAGNTRYSTLTLNEGYDPKGKVLLVECQATRDELQAKGSGLLSVLIQPHTNDGKTYFFSGWDSSPFSIPYGRTVTLKIPLDNVRQGAKLERLAFSAVPSQNSDVIEASWPSGTSLVITRLQLSDAALAKEIRAPEPGAPVDLFSRWWLCDVLREEKSNAKLMTDYVFNDNKLFLKFRGADAEKSELYGRGGAVFPQIFVDESISEVEIQLAEAGAKKNTKFTIGLYSGKKLLAEQDFNLSDVEIAKKQTMRLKDSGSLEYIAITSKEPDFKATIASIKQITKFKPTKK